MKVLLSRNPLSFSLLFPLFILEPAKILIYRG
ncbi:hypothetical protein BH24BAC1_BH24BAC1_39890 [soil metagenome]